MYGVIAFWVLSLYLQLAASLPSYGYAFATANYGSPSLQNNQAWEQLSQWQNVPREAQKSYAQSSGTPTNNQNNWPQLQNVYPANNYVQIANGVESNVQNYLNNQQQYVPVYHQQQTEATANAQVNAENVWKKVPPVNYQQHEATATTNGNRQFQGPVNQIYNTQQYMTPQVQYPVNVVQQQSGQYQYPSNVKAVHSDEDYLNEHGIKIPITQRYTVIPVQPSASKIRFPQSNEILTTNESVGNPTLSNYNAPIVRLQPIAGVPLTATEPLSPAQAATVPIIPLPTLPPSLIPLINAADDAINKETAANNDAQEAQRNLVATINQAALQLAIANETTSASTPNPTDPTSISSPSPTSTTLAFTTTMSTTPGSTTITSTTPGSSDPSPTTSNPESATPAQNPDVNAALAAVDKAKKDAEVKTNKANDTAKAAQDTLETLTDALNDLRDPNSTSAPSTPTTTPQSSTNPSTTLVASSTTPAPTTTPQSSTTPTSMTPVVSSSTSTTPVPTSTLQSSTSTLSMTTVNSSTTSTTPASVTTSESSTSPLSMTTVTSSTTSTTPAPETTPQSSTTSAASITTTTPAPPTTSQPSTTLSSTTPPASTTQSISRETTPNQRNSRSPVTFPSDDKDQLMPDMDYEDLLSNPSKLSQPTTTMTYVNDDE